MSFQNSSKTECLWIAQLGLCYLCGEAMDVEPWSRKCKNGWTEDHVRPKCQGHGKSRNILLAHYSCNCNKGNRDPTPNELDYVRRMSRIIHVLHTISNWSAGDRKLLEEALTCRQIHSLLRGALTEKSVESAILIPRHDSNQRARNGLLQLLRKKSTSLKTQLSSLTKSTPSSI